MRTLNTDDSNIIVKPKNSISFFAQKQQLINKKKALDNKLYIISKNYLYTQPRLITEPNKLLINRRNNDNHTLLPQIQSNSYDDNNTPHKTAFAIQKEKIARSALLLSLQKKAKAKEMHDESNLVRMNIKIIQDKGLKCNKAKRELVNDQMTIMKDSISNYRKLKKKYIKTNLEEELRILKEKNRIKQREIRKVIKEEVLNFYI